ncbi:alpha-E domain-containing protein, partial [Escherichia coli]|nr:alpha-E domain-containing protein [Escherichia coli]
RMSIDNWRVISGLVETAGREPDVSPGAALEHLDRCVQAMMTLSGFALDGMTRDQGWRFLSMGRRIERLQFMCTALRHALAASGEERLNSS